MVYLSRYVVYKSTCPKADIDDVYESKIFAFPQLATYYDLGYWANSDAKSYIVQIKAVEESVK